MTTGTRKARKASKKRLQLHILQTALRRPLYSEVKESVQLEHFPLSPKLHRSMPPEWLRSGRRICAVFAFRYFGLVPHVMGSVVLVLWFPGHGVCSFGTLVPHVMGSAVVVLWYHKTLQW